MGDGDYRLDNGNLRSHYSLVIQCSDEDQLFIVSFPEWGNLTHTHGATYDEALAKEVLELLIETEEAKRQPTPRAAPLYAWTRTCTLAQQTGSPYGDGASSCDTVVRKRHGQ